MIQIVAALTKLFGYTREANPPRLHSTGKRGAVHLLPPEDLEFLDDLFRHHPTGDSLYKKVKDNLNYAQEAAWKEKS